MPEPGYWTVHSRAAYLGISKWTGQSCVNADAGFPVFRGYGPDRYPIDRVKAYLQRQEAGRGRAYKTKGEKFEELGAEVQAIKQALRDRVEGRA